MPSLLCFSVLFSEPFCGSLEHLPDGQVVRTALLAQAAFDTGGGLFCYGIVTLLRPVGQAITGQVTFEQEHIGDWNSHRAGGAVVAPAAEL